MNLILCQRISDFDVFPILKPLLSSFELVVNNTDLISKLLKALYSKKELLNPKIADFLTETLLPQIIEANDEKLCKILEFTLKIIYRIRKHQKTNLIAGKLPELLKAVVDRFEINANLSAIYVKLRALVVDYTDDAEVAKLGELVCKYAYADQKEMVRVATVKSVARVLGKLDLTR